MTRILTAAILIPVVVAVVLIGPAWLFLLLAAAVGVLAYQEFHTIASAQGIANLRLPGMAAGLALLLVPDPIWPVVVGIGLVVLAIETMTVERSHQSLAAVLPGAAATFLGVVYIFGAWRSAVYLREINPHWLMIAMLVSWAGDTAAMYIGKAFGKSKLAPRISPGKTWAGTWGSVAGAILVAVIYAWWLIPEAPVWLVIVVSAIGNVAGQLGDLCESAFKRGAGVKDSGTMLPGHGGWLDRVDSSLFSIPAVYLLLTIL